MINYQKRASIMRVFIWGEGGKSKTWGGPREEKEKDSGKVPFYPCQGEKGGKILGH